MIGTECHKTNVPIFYFILLVLIMHDIQLTKKKLLTPRGSEALGELSNGTVIAQLVLAIDSY